MTNRNYWEKIDLTKNEHGKFVGPNGCSYSSPQDLMYGWGLDLCTCGRPEDVHTFLIDCLKCFDDDNDKGDFGTKGIATLVIENPNAAAEFIAHFLEQRDLTEHGGSVYGSWLTDLGEQFIEVGPMKDGLS